MIDASCGIISKIKQKYINSIDRIGYYDLNKDYEEHNKIIKNLEGNDIDECFEEC